MPGSQHEEVDEDNEVYERWCDKHEHDGVFDTDLQIAPVSSYNTLAIIAIILAMVLDTDLQIAQVGKFQLQRSSCSGYNPSYNTRYKFADRTSQ